MLRAEDGGYAVDMGWTGKKGRTEPLPHENERAEDANDSDTMAAGKSWQTIAQHTDMVVAEMIGVIQPLGLSQNDRDELLNAARWHDAGKAHEIFQKALPQPLPDDAKHWAKSMGGPPVYERRHFRHELAAALAMLQNGQSNLAAYLAASHHGKVRLSIRSLPDEKIPPNVALRFARGIWDNDTLPMTDLGGGVVLPATIINLVYMEMGEDDATGPSWLARMLLLRDDPIYGPFRLAFLEVIMRIADWRASALNEKANEEVER
jgi:CRISPR-associated endonuclease/helicase Cas3